MNKKGKNKIIKPVKIKQPSYKKYGTVLMNIIKQFQTPVAITYLDRMSGLNAYELRFGLSYLEKHKEIKRVGNSVFVPEKEILTVERKFECFKRDGGICQHPECTDYAIEVHHVVCQSKVNLKKYSASRIHSLANLMAVCRKHHINYAWCVERKRELIRKWDTEILQTIL